MVPTLTWGLSLLKVSFDIVIDFSCVLPNIYFLSIEPLKGIEPLTSSLPRKCSTTELQRHSQLAESSWQLAVTLVSNCKLLTANCKLMERKTRFEPATYKIGRAHV